MEGFLRWPVIRRHPANQRNRKGLPSAILTLSPALALDTLQITVSLLLPGNSGTRDTINAICGAKAWDGDDALALFLANPFLNLKIDGMRLRQRGLRWIANLPTVDQHDDVFVQELREVNLGPQLEIQHLAQLKSQGFFIMAIVSTVTTTELALHIDPDAVLVIPQTEQFIDSFPSMQQRHSQIATIHEVLSRASWSGDLLFLGQHFESEDHARWPEPADAMVSCPVA